jgi:hypothetical protein
MDEKKTPESYDVTYFDIEHWGKRNSTVLLIGGGSYLHKFWPMSVSREYIL